MCIRMMHSWQWIGMALPRITHLATDKLKLELHSNHDRNNETLRLNGKKVERQKKQRMLLE